MSPRLQSLLVTALILGACGPQEPSKVDPMNITGDTGTLGRTLTCEAKDSAGNCLKKSCKKDSEGDCRTYAGYCLDAGHHWSGTSDGGACSRVL
jgi:hypothetical protein